MNKILPAWLHNFASVNFSNPFKVATGHLHSGLQFLVGPKRTFPPKASGKKEAYDQSLARQGPCFLFPPDRPFKPSNIRARETAPHGPAAPATLFYLQRPLTRVCVATRHTRTNVPPASKDSGATAKTLIFLFGRMVFPSLARSQNNASPHLGGPHRRSQRHARPQGQLR